MLVAEEIRAEVAKLVRRHGEEAAAQALGDIAVAELNRLAAPPPHVPPSVRQAKPKSRRPESPEELELVERIRSALLDAIERDGVRKTGRAVGRFLSPGGLTKFAHGVTRRPYGPTWTRLKDWYAKQDTTVQAPSPEMIEAGVRVLTADFADEPELRDRVGQCVAACIIAGYDRARHATAMELS